jgi:hypothetical protein
MIPIVKGAPTGPVGYSFERFQADFLTICRDHLAQGRASLFAFILDDIMSPQVQKVLEDGHYWAALNAVSGSYLSVFAFHQPAHRGGRIERRWLYGVDDSGSMHSDAILRSYFNVERQPGASSILFFQVNDGGVSDSFFAKIRSERVEDTFLEIKKLLQLAGDMVKHLQPQMPNKDRLFDLFEREIKGRRIAATLYESVKQITDAKGMAALLKIFAGPAA